jgi:hypothetical protein
MKSRIYQRAASLVGLIRAFMLIPFLAFGAYRTCMAQAPTSLSDAVFEFTVYVPLGDHQTLTYNRWLKADGTYKTITDDASRSGADEGPFDASGGNWTYVQESSTTAQITFGDPPVGVVYALTFLNANSGTISNIQGQLSAQGTFTLRPSQFGVGPSNLSTRTSLTPGSPTIAGFVIAGTEKRFVLFRAVGPGLTSFGVSNTATQMGIVVFNSTAQVGASLDWSSSSYTTSMYQNLFAMAGAFPLVPEQGDACLVMELSPGTYTLLASSAAGGNALIEIYFLQ